MQELAGKMINEFATQSIPERNVTRMQFQLAVYADIVVDRIGDDIAMGTKVMLLDEVNFYYCDCIDPPPKPLHNT